MTIKALPWVILNAFFFGSTLIASRFSVGQYHPLNYVSLRLLLATTAHLIMYLVIINRRFPTNRELWMKAAVFGVFGTAINNSTIVMSLEYLSSGMTSVILTTAPALTALEAHFFLPEERLNKRQWIGVGFALGGAALLALAGETGLGETATDIRGYIIIFIGIISGSGASIYARRFLHKFDSIDVASIRIFVGTAIVIPFTNFSVGFDTSRVDSTGLLALLWAGLIGTFTGFMTQLQIIQRFGAVSAAMVTYIIPVVGIIGGVVLLDEVITPIMLVGIAIIFVGILLVQQKSPIQIRPIAAD